MSDLRAKAEAAMGTAPGPWSRTTSGDPHWLREVRSESGSIAWCGDTSDARAHALSAFIAAASPDVVIALLDRVEALRILALREVSYRTLHGDWACSECGQYRATSRDDDPDDHEPGCLLRKVVD